MWKRLICKILGHKPHEVIWNSVCWDVQENGDRVIKHYETIDTVCDRCYISLGVIDIGIPTKIEVIPFDAKVKEK